MKKKSDDAETFREAVRDVKPLAAASPPPGSAKKPPRPRKLRASPPRLAAADSAEHGDRSRSRAHAGLSAGPPLLPEEPVGAEDALAFRRGGVQDQVIRRLRRGLYPIDDTLDLHGLVIAQAWDALTEFLRASRDSSCRCVRVVHGKGYRSGARGPVLKTAMNEWLRHNHDVVAFCSARALDGGLGAVYVLLRA